MTTTGWNIQDDRVQRLEELTGNTQEFWRLSSAWNGRTKYYVKRKLTVETAIKKTNLLLSCTAPERPLYHATMSLSDELIEGSGTKAVEPAKITQLPRIDAEGNVFL